jgi:hypothetical protein
MTEGNYVTCTLRPSRRTAAPDMRQATREPCEAAVQVICIPRRGFAYRG